MSKVLGRIDHTRIKLLARARRFNATLVGSDAVRARLTRMRELVLYGSAEISGRECVIYLEPRFACGHLLKSRQIRSPGDRAE